MAGHLIRRLHQQSTQVFQARTQAAGFDLTSVQFAALDGIERQPGIDQASLAAAISFDRATIGGVIDRLEQGPGGARGQRPGSARVSSAADGRSAQLLAACRPVVEALQAEILAPLGGRAQDLLALARKAPGLG